MFCFLKESTEISLYPEDGDEVSPLNVGVVKLPDAAVSPRGFYFNEVGLLCLVCHYI
jgi:hypothetical protein